MIADLASTWDSVLATPGLIWIFAVTLVAGTMYGFAGFGAGLIFVPVVAVFLEPRATVVTFMLSSLASLMVVVPGAWPKADRPVVVQMIAVALVFSLGGLWLLDNGDVTLLRWGILVICAVTLAAMISGWRRKGRATPLTRGGVAAAAGVLGGAAGLAGPVFVVFQLSGGARAEQLRANIACFLTLSSVALIPLMALRGMMRSEDVMLGLMILPLYALGNWIGTRLFDPAREALYRRVAYGLIACAIVIGLPVFD